MPGPEQVLDALRVVMDPDLHADIVQLGFIKDLAVDGRAVSFEVELTTPACPARRSLEEQARAAVAGLPWVERVQVRMTARTRGRVRGDDEGALAGVRNLIAVTSGKGGVGKSATAVNLAAALAATGARVGLLDADIYGPSVTHLTGVGPPEDTGDGLLVPPVRHGIALASMAMFVPAKRPMVLRGPRIAGVVRQLLTGFAWGELDYLLIDCPPGTGDVQITLAQQAPLSGAVIVTTPQEAALIDVRRAMGMLKMVDVPVLGIVETMSGFVCDHCDTLHDLFGRGGGQRIAEEFDVPMLGQIPLDPRVMEAGEAAVPVVLRHPESPAARSYLEAAGALAARVAVLQCGAPPALDTFELEWKRDG